MKQDDKKIGLGSISLILVIIGIFFSSSFGNQESYGDDVVRILGLKPWSNGDHGVHYTIFYSLIFYTPALILGHKFNSDLGANLGKTLSFVLIIILLILALLFLIGF